MNSRISRRTLGMIAGAALAVGAAGTTYALVDTEEPTDVGRVTTSVTATDQSQLAAWAEANGLTGLSPVSMRVAPARPTAVDQSQLAAWAEANGLTGLSPVSMSVAPTPPTTVDQSGIAAWARENGLTGLSPASLASAD